MDATAPKNEILTRKNRKIQSMIRHSNNITQSHSLSTVQNNFLRYLSYKSYYKRLPHFGYDITVIFSYFL